MNGVDSGKTNSVLMGRPSIARWLLEPQFYHVIKSDLTIICNDCGLAVPSKQITKSKHTECNRPINHWLLNDPLLSEITILYDDFSCGRANFHDDLMSFINAGKRIHIVEYLPNQRTISYLIKNVHYTRMTRYVNVKWPTRIIDLPSDTYDAIGWAGHCYPGANLESIIEKCQKSGVPLFAFGVIDSTDDSECTVGYSYYNHISKKYPHVPFVIEKSPVDCIFEAARCKTLTYTQDHKWMYNYCSSAQRCIVNNSTVTFDSLDWYTNSDLESTIRHYNLVNSTIKLT